MQLCPSITAGQCPLLAPPSRFLPRTVSSTWGLICCMGHCSALWRVPGLGGPPRPGPQEGSQAGPRRLGSESPRGGGRRGFNRMEGNPRTVRSHAQKRHKMGKLRLEQVHDFPLITRGGHGKARPEGKLFPPSWAVPAGYVCCAPGAQGPACALAPTSSLCHPTCRGRPLLQDGSGTPHGPQPPPSQPRLWLGSPAPPLRLWGPQGLHLSGLK